MRKILVLLLATVLLVGCKENVEKKIPGVNSETIIDKTNFRVIKWTADGHTYYTISSGYSDSGMNTFHSEACPCKKGKN